MTPLEYVEKARQDGRKIERKQANGIDYLFITEADGWISIMGYTNGRYYTVIQARDMAHAESYIAMIEPVTVPLRRIEEW